MRSRYSAYVLGDTAYLLATWYAGTRPVTLDPDAGGRPKWLGLQVLAHLPEGESQASVEFVARYKSGGRAQRLHEKSRFVRESGRWYYVDGEFPDPA